MTDTPEERPLANQHILIVLEKKGHVGANVREHFRVYREAGARLTLCFLTGDGSEYQSDRPADSVTGLRLSDKASRRNRIATAWRLARILRRDRPDVMIGDQYKCVASLLLASVIARHGRPIYALLRGYYATDSRSRQRYYQAFRKRLTGILTLTDAQRDRFIANMPWYPTDSISVVHNYIDAHRLRTTMLSKTEARERLGLDEDQFVFGCVARFDSYKRITDLLKAFAKLQTRDAAQAQLVIIGDGKERAALHAETRDLGIHSRTLFTGFLAGANRYMQAFDVFVLPSEGDNFARVFLEAMAAEIPVVGVRGGGTPEVLGTTGYLAPPRDPAALSEILDQLIRLSPDERCAAGRKGREESEIRFTREGLRRQLLGALSGSMMQARTLQPDGI
ncbi:MULTISPECIES: glycosyltransferase [unclassified Thioalkalivibrio]|uniref:glycosyltransferase n=1 Tax=unclassified Thioalkalivibrio TaxID=2621013 RepID=UPI00036CB900|nr:MULTISPECIES: glycosyltransferase [unclassified Thioalkalivibrio]